VLIFICSLCLHYFFCFTHELIDITQHAEQPGQLVAAGFNGNDFFLRGTGIAGHVHLAALRGKPAVTRFNQSN
jgi:hypothetical protein